MSAGFGRLEDSPVYADQFQIYTGNANRDLAEKICRYLGSELGDAQVFEFANENIFVKIMENVREKDVFLVQPTSHPVLSSGEWGARRDICLGSMLEPYAA